MKPDRLGHNRGASRDVAKQCSGANRTMGLGHLGGTGASLPKAECVETAGRLIIITRENYSKSALS